mmetsp:Transcript_7680/g.12898  ORF Transcript_7680/g.12898 Transcript_7680/m.12898 type:complete len:223 (-) Transcript_7680:2430-3098(-)
MMRLPYLSLSCTDLASSLSTLSGWSVGEGELVPGPEDGPSSVIFCPSATNFILPLQPDAVPGGLGFSILLPLPFGVGGFACCAATLLRNFSAVVGSTTISAVSVRKVGGGTSVVSVALLPDEPRFFPTSAMVCSSANSSSSLRSSMSSVPCVIGGSVAPCGLDIFMTIGDPPPPPRGPMLAEGGRELVLLPGSRSSRAGPIEMEPGAMIRALVRALTEMLET